MQEEFDAVMKTIMALLENKRYASIKDIFGTLKPADVAAMFDELGPH